MSDQFAELADKLDAIAEEIAETAIDELRSALRRGESKRPIREKQLTQARRAIDKAAHLLRNLEALETTAPRSVNAASDEFD